MEQISGQINFFARNILCGGDFRSYVPGNKNVIINMQIWDEPCRLQTLPYDDTQGNINRRENRGKELKNVGMNFSPTCRQKPERH